MKKIISLLSIILFIVGCFSEEEIINDCTLSVINPKFQDITIDINTTRNPGNILLSNRVQTRSNDPFTEMREVESSESVVLPELIPHIWIGNIMKISSIANCDYKPLVYSRTPIKISLILPNTASQEIVNPSFSSYLSYIQAQTEKGSFKQNGEFNFTIEQFSSYNELKVAFGSNVNTKVLFWGSSSSSSKENESISKATGLYVKFYQTSFKAIMDYPQKQIATIPESIIDSAAYINSISYGRLGIMTLETNSTVQYSRETVNTVFKKLFTSGTTSLTIEERSFLDGCDYKLYQIGGNSATSVESFTGYDGFAQHIKKGSFSKEEPGVPLFCTFNHVRDNSPVKIKFKYNIKKEPLYVELVHKPKANKSSLYAGSGDLYLYFYKNKSKIPTIAPPSVTFKLKIIKTDIDYYGDQKVKVEEFEYQNAGYQTCILVKPDMQTLIIRPRHATGPPWDRELEGGGRILYAYELIENTNYEIIGKNPIDHSNTAN